MVSPPSPTTIGGGGDSVCHNTMTKFPLLVDPNVWLGGGGGEDEQIWEKGTKEKKKTHEEEIRKN